MTPLALRLALLIALFAALLPAQFSIAQVTGAAEIPVGAVLSLGSLRQGETVGMRLRIRNASSGPASLSPPRVDGEGFTITDSPPDITTLEPLAAIDITLAYKATAIGTFSGLLFSDRISLLATVTVLPPLVCQVDTGSGLRDAAASTVSFGSVERGTRRTRVFILENRSALPTVAPAISVVGAGFAVAGPVPSGSTLQPRDTASFEISFSPAAAGWFPATLKVGERQYALEGSGSEPSLPKPFLNVDVAARSGEQGSVKARFETVARTSGTGSLSLAFVSRSGAADPAIQFASGGSTIEFAVAPGDTESPEFRFQTGTTAGTLTVSVEMGGIVVEQKVVVDPAPVTVTAIETVRSPSSVEIRLTGFDNTRSISALAFTFFDSAGGSIAPGAVRVDAASQFASYFASSSQGGIFQLRIVFPVTGDASRIAAFEAEISNVAGPRAVPRTKIP